MCIFRAPSPPPPAPMPSAPPIMSRTNQGLESNPLPTKKELVDPDEVAGVKYGSDTKAKDTTRGAAKRTGTDALKINLNTGAGPTGGGTGGINV